MQVTHWRANKPTTSGKETTAKISPKAFESVKQCTCVQTGLTWRGREGGGKANCGITCREVGKGNALENNAHANNCGNGM